MSSMLRGFLFLQSYEICITLLLISVYLSLGAGCSSVSSFVHDLGPDSLV